MARETEDIPQLPPSPRQLSVALYSVSDIEDPNLRPSDGQIDNLQEFPPLPEQLTIDLYSYDDLEPPTVTHDLGSRDIPEILPSSREFSISLYPFQETDDEGEVEVVHPSPQQISIALHPLSDVDQLQPSLYRGSAMEANLQPTPLSIPLYSLSEMSEIAATNRGSNQPLNLSVALHAEVPGEDSIQRSQGTPSVVHEATSIRSKDEQVVEEVTAASSSSGGKPPTLPAIIGSSDIHNFNPTVHHGRGAGFRGSPRGGLRGWGGRGRGARSTFQPDNPDRQLVASLHTLQLRQNELPVRRGFGTAGIPVKLRTNYFPVQFNKIGTYYEYSVTIYPNPPFRRLKRRIFQLAEQSADWANFGLHGLVAHDSSSRLISAKQIPQPITVKIQYFDEGQQAPRTDGKEFALTIRFVQTLNLSDLHKYLFGQPQYREFNVKPTITAFNLILGAHANRFNGGGIMVGRNRFFFPDSMESFNLGGGLQAFKGFYSSVRPAHRQLMVNVNVCTAAFYKPQNLAETLLEFRNASFDAWPAAFVKGVRVMTLPLKHPKTVKTLSNITAKECRFTVAEYNSAVSMEQYFFQKYNIRLRYLDIPLIDVGGQKQNLMPAELCQILPNQPHRGKLTDQWMAEMIKYAAKPPNSNAIAITTKGLDELGFRQGASPQMNAFGVSVGNMMAVVPARILPPPRIQYGKGTPFVDDKASWNLRGVRFARGARLENWAVLVILDGNANVEFSGPKDREFVATYRGFAEMCRKTGMVVDQVDPLVAAARLTPGSPDDLTRTKAISEIEMALKTMKKKPNIVLVILSNGDQHIYSGLKYLCDIVLDVATVCVQSAKIRKERSQLQYLASVALKLNTKLGGINHDLDPGSMTWLKKVPTMLVGIAVTHPGPGSVRGTPSIAAVVATCESRFAHYPASMEIQECRTNMVTNLDRMMATRLELFKTRNRTLPQRILVYRNGVPEGQYQTILNEELPLLKLAFKKYDTAQMPYNPALAIVVCGKSRHTRFYPTDHSQSDSQGNLQPGTVVDRGVTAIYNNDFFLQAHGGLQGTTRPIHYCVIHDGIEFEANELQVLTNSISYMFARATKAVSLVPPVYYASLACKRGRCYLHKLSHMFGLQNPTEESVLKAAEAAWRQGVNGRAMKDTMYYL